MGAPREAGMNYVTDTDVADAQVILQILHQVPEHDAWCLDPGYSFICAAHRYELYCIAAALGATERAADLAIAASNDVSEAWTLGDVPDLWVRAPASQRFLFSDELEAEAMLRDGWLPRMFEVRNSLEENDMTDALRMTAGWNNAIRGEGWSEVERWFPGCSAAYDLNSELQHKIDAIECRAPSYGEPKVRFKVFCGGNQLMLYYGYEDGEDTWGRAAYDAGEERWVDLGGRGDIMVWLAPWNDKPDREPPT
jgi:hypothetical protein